MRRSKRKASKNATTGTTSAAPTVNMRRSKSKKASKNATTGTTSAAPTVNMRRSKSKKASKNATTGTTSAAPTVPAVSISELPNHITCDILSRLPLNSIFACKRVCKTWRDLTLEPYFAKLHLSSSPLSLIFYHNGNNNDDPLSSHFEIVQLHDPLGRWDATMKFRTEIYFPHMYVVASCNGSILLSNSSPNDYRIIVCNPLRAQHFILPNPPKLALQTHESVIRLGIGHSPRTNQYKVLRFTSTNGPARLYMYCDIFTIGIDDEWRSIVGTEQPPALIVSNFVFLNGALHWIGLEKSRFICYFDIEKEQFGSFPLPSHVGKSCNYLGVVDNRLYLHNDQSSTVWRSWALKDYGDFESWTLEWVIEEEPIILCFTGSIKPLKMLKDGSLLMMFNKTSARTRFTKTTLACYNPHTRVLKKNKYHLSGRWGAAVADISCFFSPTDALKRLC